MQLDFSKNTQSINRLCVLKEKNKFNVSDRQNENERYFI